MSNKAPVGFNNQYLERTRSECVAAEMLLTKATKVVAFDIMMGLIIYGSSIKDVLSKILFGHPH